jgi:hypothetical protein
VAQIDITVNSNVLDSPILEQTEFGPDMKNWLSNSVDIINSEIMTVQTLTTDINNLFNTLLGVGTVDATGTGLSRIVPLLGLTTSGFVIATLLSSTAPSTITSVDAQTNQFQVNFSVDPGVSAIISYSAFSRNPQG